jgi:hypothetical protein
MINFSWFVRIFIVFIGLTTSANAQQSERDILSDDEWQRIDNSLERASQWLATQQQPDGSFPTLMRGQPGVTSLCVLALTSQGHLPEKGRYGTQLQRAIEFILSCQKQNGLIALVAPEDIEIPRDTPLEVGSTAVYNHALSGLALGEVYSMSSSNSDKHRAAIEKAIKTTLKMQTWPKPLKEDQGGWRYVTRRDDKPDSDLSVTGWQVMFLRSAKNAGFDVPQKPIDDAVAYIRRCFQRQYGTFTMLATTEDRRSRGMAGAGILAMAHAGLQESNEARLSGDWLLREGFPKYNESRHYAGPGYTDDRYHYGVFCACHAMHQLGGKYWREFYPPVAKVILANQRTNGSWSADSHFMDGMFGNAYTTALMILTLGASNQLLPIFQR